jgi:hypothetical protein
LLLAQISRTPNQTFNFAYVNAYIGIGNFMSAARRPDTGGPLGRLGILFEPVGLGRYGSGLNSRPADSGGISVGYQMFFDGTRRQVTVETGGRAATHLSRQTAIALGGRFQQAFGQHVILQFDSFVSGQEHRSVGTGGRTEVLFKF